MSGTVLLLLGCCFSAAEDAANSATQAFDPRAVALEFVDQSVLKLVLADERIEIVTPHGKLQVPTDDIRRIEFAQRLPHETAQRIDELLKQLGDPSREVHEAAAAELLAIGGPAWLSLCKAAKSGQIDLAPRAAAIVKKLKPKLTKEQLAVREDDLIETEDARIAGRINMPQLKIRTAQFGELAFKLADARSLRHQSLLARPEEPAEPDNVLSDPGNLKAYEARRGETFSFRITGAVAGGSIWGTDVYTTDSNLAMAAVHAGVLKAGESSVVRVKILPSPPSFTGSVRNGVSTSGYGVYGGAYEFVKGEEE